MNCLISKLGQANKRGTTWDWKSSDLLELFSEENCDGQKIRWFRSEVQRTNNRYLTERLAIKMSEKKMIKHIPKNEVAKPFGEITNRKNKKIKYWG